MLIKALCDYSQKHAEKSGAAVAEGWGELEVQFRIMLTPEGDISSIIDLREQVAEEGKNGKVKTKLVPQKIIVPERTQKTCVDANLIEHRPLYIFGLNCDKGVFTPDDRTNKARKSHEAFVQLQLEFFEDLDSEICKAYVNFVKKWNPNDETENPLLLQIAKDYGTARFSFGLAGARGNLEEDAQFAEKYNEYFARQKAQCGDTANVDVCGILGEKLPTARLHDKIKFPGGQTMGCQVVCMNDTAFESYGKTQSYNSNVSEKAMKMYTAELGRLVGDKNHRVIIDDLVIIYFAMKSDDSAECTVMSMLMSDSADNADKKVEGMLNSVMSEASGGATGDLSAFGVDLNATYYIAGMTANSSRICQKFICRDKFGKVIENLVMHQADLAINPDNKRQIYFSRIKRELISPKSTNEKVPPPLMTSIIIAALNGTKYPRAMLETVIRRVKTDSDDDKNHFIKINDTRMGIIKACINRSLRLSGKEEEITMALNEQNNHPAYLCGRLFAVYEKIQQDSAGGAKLNRTIKDSYFASACARPATIMPKLDKLAQNHLRKLSESANVYYKKLVGDIANRLEGEFPQTLDLDSQGRFIIGYYQQNKDLYTKSDKNSDERKDN